MKIIFTAEDKRNIRRFEGEFMLGTLASQSDEFFQSYDYKVINSKHDVEIVDFYIKPLSEEYSIIKQINKNLKSEEYYIGQSSQINDQILGIEKIYFLDDKEKQIRQQLENKLILFKPVIKIKDDQFNPGESKIFKNVYIEKIFQSKNVLDSYLKVIEIFEKNNEFEIKILNGETIEFEDGFSENPEIVLCGDYLYDFGAAYWQKDENKFKVKNGSTVYKKVLNHEIDRFIKTPNKNLFFIEEDIIYNEDFKKDYIELKNENIEKIEIKVEENILGLKKQLSKSEPEVKSIEMSDEVKFLNNLLIHSIDKGLFYKESDLINFHICLKTNYLTILAGMSGTGKSKLTRLYSEALNKSSEDKLLFIPISPSYTEPSDILGYYNPNTCLYQPAETGLIDFLVNANKDENKNNLFIIVFDEMNLAQIEYWFAPFISIMEEKNQAQRLLRLYSDKLNCINDFLYSPTIKIGNNIRFIGTINLDETSKNISDRVLDRANIINLEKLTFNECKKILDNNNKDMEKKYVVDYETFSDWIKTDIPLKRMSDSELYFFDKLHSLISKYDNQKGVSFRILEQIGNYLNNIPMSSEKGSLICKKEAIDIQINQRILSKLKGSNDNLNELLGTFNLDENKIENSLLFNLLNEDCGSEISDFEKSKKEILRKSKELYIYGYTN